MFDETVIERNEVGISRVLEKRKVNELEQLVSEEIPHSLSVIFLHSFQTLLVVWIFRSEALQTLDYSLIHYLINIISSSHICDRLSTSHHTECSCVYGNLNILGYANLCICVTSS